MNQPKEQKLQFIRFDRGISQFNHDYYAALGLPIISNPMYIRNVYLRIARILHPDIYGFSAQEKLIATQYLAKLVNPAYNALIKEQDRQAYQGIFKLLAKRLMQRSRNIEIHSESACELMMTPSDEIYEQLVTEIAKVQYQSLTSILEHTSEISELNLVYILYKEGYRHADVNRPQVLLPMSSPKSTKTATKNFLPPPSKPSYAYNLQHPPNQYSINSQSSSDETIIQQVDGNETVIQARVEDTDMQTINRIKVCEIYILQGNWKAALQDLRDILRTDVNNSKCLALLGVVYININQPQMAKASFKRSLYLNPQEPIALKHFLEFDSPNFTQSSSAAKSVTKRNLSILKEEISSAQNSWLSKVISWIVPRK